MITKRRWFGNDRAVRRGLPGEPLVSTIASEPVDVHAVRGHFAFPRLGRIVTRRPIIVIGFWIVLAAVLSLALPPLAVVIGQKQAAIMPDDAPVMVATRQMVEAFHDKGTDNVLLAVLIDDNLPNVEGAHAFGVKAVHHRSAEETIAALRALGLPA